MQWHSMTAGILFPSVRMLNIHIVRWCPFCQASMLCFDVVLDPTEGHLIMLQHNALIWADSAKHIPDPFCHMHFFFQVEIKASKPKWFFSITKLSNLFNQLRGHFYRNLAKCPWNSSNPNYFSYYLRWGGGAESRLPTMSIISLQLWCL